MKLFLVFASMSLGLWSTQFCVGNTPLVLDKSTISEDVWPYVGLFIDSTSDVGIEDISTFLFNYNKPENPSFSITDDAYWITFDVVNEASSEMGWLFEFAYPTLSEIQIFVYADGNLQKQILSGLYHQNEFSGLRFRNPVFSFDMEQNVPYTVFARIKTNSSMQIPLKVYSYTGFFDQDRRDRGILILLIGILLTTVIFNFTLFFITREMMYLYLSFCLLFIDVHFFIATGFIGELNHGIAPLWIERLRMIAYLASDMLAFLFALYYLELSKYSRFLYWLFIGSATGFLVFMIAAMIPSVSFLSLNYLTGILHIYIVLVIISGSIAVIIKGNKTAWYYLLAVSVFIFGAFFLTDFLVDGWGRISSFRMGPY